MLIMDDILSQNPIAQTAIEDNQSNAAIKYGVSRPKVAREIEKIKSKMIDICV